MKKLYQYLDESITNNNTDNATDNASINEDSGFMAKIKSLKSHTNAWNSLVKWYDREINHMDMYEIAKLLREAAKAIDDASFDTLK